MTSEPLSQEVKICQNQEVKSGNYSSYIIYINFC